MRFFISAGQIGDYTGAAALLSNLLKVDWMLADSGYEWVWVLAAQ